MKIYSLISVVFFGYLFSLSVSFEPSATTPVSQSLSNKSTAKHHTLEQFAHDLYLPAKNDFKFINNLHRGSL